MWISFIVLSVVGIILGTIAYSQGALMKGVREGGSLFIKLLPLLAVAFIVTGLFQNVVPKGVISKFLGKEAGVKGIVIAWLLGIITPGGPVVNFPIIAALYKSGASLASVCAMLSSWGLISIFRFVTYEIPILGMHIAFTRYTASFAFPLLIGLIVWTVFR